MPESVQDEGLKEAYTEANQQNWTKSELDDYLRASIKERDEIGRIEFAEKKAERRGEIIGEKKGEIKGERKSTIKVIIQGRKLGLSINDLSTLTGLTKEEIEGL